VFENIESVGSETEELTILTRDTRKELIIQAQEEAVRMGANAIIGLTFETNVIFRGAVDIVIYGTAVILSKKLANNYTLQCFLLDNCNNSFKKI